MASRTHLVGRAHPAVEEEGNPHGVPRTTALPGRRRRWPCRRVSSVTACLVLTLSATVAPASAALFGTAEDEDEASYAKLARSAMASASTADFDAAATLEQIRSSPAVQEKMRAMMSDPKALAELTDLMKDPAFKAQVEAFAGNAEVASAIKNKGAAAFFGGNDGRSSVPAAGDARKEAQRRAEAELEYQQYASQFTGEENAAAGLRNLVAAAKDSTLLADALRDLNDPQMMASARDMMADPAFQAEMKRMMDQPEMRQILDASRNFVQDLAKDPQKMKQVQDRVAKLTAGAALSGEL